MYIKYRTVTYILNLTATFVFPHSLTSAAVMSAKLTYGFYGIFKYIFSHSRNFHVGTKYGWLDRHPRDHTVAGRLLMPRHRKLVMVS